MYNKRLQTCIHCRKAHRKCDGVTPCYNCFTRNLHCEYPLYKNVVREKQRKRELQLESELLRLRTEYERLQQSQQYWKNRVLKVSDERKKRKVVKEGDLSFVVLAYLDRMLNGNTFISGCYPQDFVERVPNLLPRMEEDDVDIKDLFILRGLLANCFIKAHDKERGDNHLQKAFEIANKLENALDIDIACGFANLAAVCFSRGHLEKMFKYAMIARTMFEQLDAKSHPFYKHVLVLQLFGEPKYKKKKQLVKGISSLKLDGEHRFQSVFRALAIYVELEKEYEYDSVKLLQICDKLQDPTLKRKYDPLSLLHFDTLVVALTARAYAKAGLGFMAQQQAQKIQQLFFSAIDVPFLGPLAAAICLKALCDTHLLLGKWQDLQTDIQLAQQYAFTFPLSEGIAKEYQHRFLIASTGTPSNRIKIPTNDKDRKDVEDILGPKVNIFDAQDKLITNSCAVHNLNSF